MRAGASAAEATEQIDGLAAGDVRPETDVAGNRRHPSMQTRGVAPRVGVEYGRRARGGTCEAEADADGGRLAGAVGSEEAVHPALLDDEIEPVERVAAPVAFGQ